MSGLKSNKLSLNTTKPIINVFHVVEIVQCIKHFGVILDSKIWMGIGIMYKA